jgi:hypothetical protein
MLLNILTSGWSIANGKGEGDNCCFLHTVNWLGRPYRMELVSLVRAARVGVRGCGGDCRRTPRGGRAVMLYAIRYSQPFSNYVRQSDWRTLFITTRIFEVSKFNIFYVMFYKHSCEERRKSKVLIYMVILHAVSDPLLGPCVRLSLPAIYEWHIPYANG